jgi:serine phosphatase RsbU (regulator of sigma subunit)
LNADKQAEEVGQNIVSEVQRLNQHKFEDDLTLLILRKVAPENFAN